MGKLSIDLPTLDAAQRQQRPVSKPRQRILDRVAYKRELEAKDRAFRLAVWLRDGGRCRHCGRPVKRTLTVGPEQGHVHHRHGRRVRPEDRFNPDMAVLLCAIDHADPKVIATFRKGRG